MIAVDVETTGLSLFCGHRVVELGAVRLDGQTVAQEFQCLIDCGRKITKHAQRIHGIGDDMLQGQPQPRAAFSSFRAFIGDSVLVSHNAPFDLWFLRQEFGRQGWRLVNRTTCTLELSRRRLPGLPDHRLQTVARHLLGALPDGLRLHRALDDARLTGMVWLALKRKGDLVVDDERKVGSAIDG